MHINIPLPELQIDFSFALGEIRNLYLQDALKQTVQSMDIEKMDQELAKHVPSKYLSLLASHGLRGELVFPVPCLLEANPRLLGYYRLLLGFSKKAFYTKEFGLTSFQNMEVRGTISEENKVGLDVLCKSIIQSACALLDNISDYQVCQSFFDDLTLLTLGPQLRGGANVKRGTAGTVSVFNVINEIVENAVSKAGINRMELLNAADRIVLIEFAPDPDIIIREEMTTGKYRNIIAIEVKGGKDFSNIHNRIGEAEKSHQKARNAGFVECWTVVNVDRIDLNIAQKESPSTNRFYILSTLESRTGQEFEDFKSRIISLSGIR
jgi:hypothetical protein